MKLRDLCVFSANKKSCSFKGKTRLYQKATFFQKGQLPLLILEFDWDKTSFLYCLSLSLPPSLLPKLLFACTDSARTTATITKTNSSGAGKHNIIFLQRFYSILIFRHLPHAETLSRPSAKLRRIILRLSLTPGTKEGESQSTVTVSYLSWGQRAGWPPGL